MKYNINNNCLECGYEYTKDKYCEICGTKRVNYCSGSHFKNTEIDYTTPCEEPLVQEARYCSLCGASSTFYEEGLLHAWDAPATKNELKYTSPYKLLASRHSLLEMFEERLIDLDQTISNRMNQYLHSIMYPAYMLMDEHINSSNMQELTYTATKLTTVLLKSYLDGYNTKNIYDVGAYEEGNHPLGNFKNQLKVREILFDALQKIDEIYPEPAASKKIEKVSTTPYTTPKIKTSYAKYELEDQIDFTQPYLTIDQMKQAIQGGNNVHNGYFEYGVSTTDIIKELENQFNSAFPDGVDEDELRLPILVFPIPTGVMWDPIKYGFIAKYEANGDSYIYSPIPIPNLE